MIDEALHLLVRATLIASVAIVVVLVLRRSTRRLFGARAVYRLWLLVPVAAGAGLLPAPVVPHAGVLHMFALGVVQAVPDAPLSVASFDGPFWLFMAWLAGVLVAAVTFIVQQRRYLRSLGQLARDDAGRLRTDAADACPAVVGALFARIVLPADFEAQYAAGERALVLAHEEAHLARGDAQINAMVAALRCLQWFNPLAHWAAAHFRFDQELACDAVVVSQFPEARRCYADAMLKTQLAGQAWQELRLPAGCHWPFGHPLKERIAMLKQPLPGRIRRALGLGFAAVLIGSLSYGAWATQAGTDKAATTEGSSPAHYARLSPIAYPEKTAVAGDCVALVALDIDARGAAANLAALTVHGKAPRDLCRRWGMQAASAIMAKWSFEPATRDAKPVASRVTVPVVFTAHADDDFDGSEIPADALDAIRISALPNVSTIAPSANSAVPEIAGASDKAMLEQRSIEAAMPWKFSLGRENADAEGDGC